MWDSAMDECDVCQCSRMIKRGFNLSPPSCDSFSDDNSFDKENIPQLSPLKNEAEISLYGNSSPERMSCGDTSPSHCSRHFRRRPLEDHDPNSLDSGYYASFEQTNSLNSIDDAFFDITGITPLEDDDSPLPTDFSKLITGPISMLEKNFSPKNARPIFRRPLSEQPPKKNDFKIQDDDVRPFKRPDAPQELRSPREVKRCKLFDTACSKPPLLRSRSREETIKVAVHRSDSRPNLIGDFSKTYCLPVIPGRHQDLKSITPSTLAELVVGFHEESVASYKVIDCRYPYEFEGGHISGAVNIYTKEQCMKLLDDNNLPMMSESGNPKRHILIFHCEFSSERGPTLSRFLRNMDRSQNESSYPSLHYPEVYLLDGGYKSFYERYPELCNPAAYKPMLHPEHKDDLRWFRAKSKSWNVDGRRALQKAATVKRIPFNQL